MKWGSGYFLPHDTQEYVVIKRLPIILRSGELEPNRWRFLSKGTQLSESSGKGSSGSNMRQETTNLAAAAQKNAEAPALKPCRVVLMEGLVRGGEGVKDLHRNKRSGIDEGWGMSAEQGLRDSLWGRRRNWGTWRPFLPAQLVGRFSSLTYTN